MRIAAAVLVLAFTIGTAGSVFAARVNCTVDAVEGDKVTMTCKEADKINVGDKAKVSTSKKGAVEGC